MDANCTEAVSQPRLSKSALVPIASIKTEHCHRKHVGDLAALAASIRTQGLLQAIGISEDNELAFGKRRLLACRDVLGWTHIPASIVNVTSLVEAEHDENELRLAFKPMERVGLAKLVKAELGRRAGRPKASSDEIPADRPELSKGKESREIAAKKAGFSSTTQLRRAEVVHDRGIEELRQAVDEGKIKLTSAEKIAQLPKADQKILVESNAKPPAPVSPRNRKPKTTIAREKAGHVFTAHAKLAAEDYERLASDTLKALTAANKGLLAIADSTLNSGAWVNVKHLISLVSDIRRQLKEGAPCVACPDCKGHCCASCQQCGFLNKGAFEKRSKK